MRLLHIDIETAPNKAYVWGLWNQNVGINQIVEPGYTLCWAAKWHGKKEVMFDSVQESGAKAMIKRVHALLNEADVVCHYNGQKFDVPTLQGEFLQSDLPPPDPFKQLDLLRTARKEFRFPSNKLDYISQQLGIGSKVSHKGMELWRDCMDGCPKAWRVMKRYNVQDVRLLVNCTISDPFRERVLKILESLIHVPKLGTGRAVMAVSVGLIGVGEFHTNSPSGAAWSRVRPLRGVWQSLHRYRS